MYVHETDKTPYELVTRSNRKTGRIVRKVIREGEALPGVGFTADLVYYQTGNGVFSAPRHKHNFNQIRYIVQGSGDFGNNQLATEGQVTFFPAGAEYGPEEIDEAEVMLIQWSEDWVTREQHDATYAEMQQNGEFKDGFYVTVDSDGNEARADGRNAVWETFTGKKMNYPVPQYPQPVVMEPAAFEWRETGTGVAKKMMGRFTEDDVYLASYRWAPGASLTLTPERTQLLWITSGAVQINGRSHPARTAVFGDHGETLEVTSRDGAEAICFGLPVPSPAG